MVQYVLTTLLLKRASLNDYLKLSKLPCHNFSSCFKIPYNISDYTSIKIVYCLNAILCPPLKQIKNRPTIKNAQDSVLVKVDNEEDITTKVAKFIKSWKAEGEEPHPLMFWKETTGGDLMYVLIFHNVRYEFRKFCDCMDVCFKLYLTFNIKFPHASKQYFIFLNEIFYKVTLKHSKSSKILTLIQDLDDLEDRY